MKVYSEFIYGIKASKEMMEKFLNEAKDKNIYHEGKGITLFNLHEDWYSLDAWYEGKEDNPEYIVIGAALQGQYDRKIISIGDIEDCLNATKDFFQEFGQEHEIREVLKDYESKLELFLVTTQYK